MRPTDLFDDDLWNMFEACRTGDFERVQQLAASRPDLLVAEYNYTPPIHYAVREGHLEITRYLLEHGADPGYRSYPFGESLLTYARELGHEPVAELLLSYARNKYPVREDVLQFLEAADAGDVTAIERDPGLARASNDVGDTGLIRAVMHRKMDAARRLIEAGADLDAARSDGMRAIHFAIDRGPREMLDLLLDAGARRDIYIHAALGDIAAVEAELARDASLANFSDTAMRRPVSAAARRNDLAMVDLLLKHGANPSLPEMGAPLGGALWIAVYQEQTEMVRLLLAHGANPNTAPESSGPALMHAPQGSEIRAMLLAAGASEPVRPLRDLEDAIQNGDKDTVRKLMPRATQLAYWGEGILCGPCGNRDFEMIQLLLDLGATVPRHTKWGAEYYFKHADVGRFLLERGMDPDHSNWHRVTLLHHFAAKGDLQKMQALIDHGANLEAVDEEFRTTPIGYAARWGNTDAALLLARHGADVEPALHWAHKRGHSALDATLRTYNGRQ